MSHTPGAISILFTTLGITFQELIPGGSSELGKRLSETGDHLAKNDIQQEPISTIDLARLLRQSVGLFEHFGLQSLADARISCFQAIAIAARDQDTHELLRASGTNEDAIRLLEDLDEVFDLQSPVLKHEWLQLRFESWRLIANMCADDDVSREALSQPKNLTVLFTCFTHDVQAFLPVQKGDVDHELKRRCVDAPSQALYNLLSFEPARPRCQQNGLVDVLNVVFERYRTACCGSQAHVSLPAMIWDIFEEMMIDWAVERSPTALPFNVVTALLYENDLSEKESIMNALLSHTQSGQFSSYFASSPFRLWSLFCLFYNLQGETWLLPPADERPDYSLMKPLELPASPSDTKKTCLLAIADVVERPEFSQALEQMSTSELKNLTQCLRWPSSGTGRKNEDLIECTCMVLGNFACSNETSQRLVSEFHVETLLLPVLEYAEQYSTKTMATRLLKNLAIPESNRDILGTKGGLFKHLSSGLKESVRGELLQATISTARVLVTPANARQMVVDTIATNGAEEETSEGGPTGSFLQRMLHTVDQTEDPGLKIEAGRFVKRLLQCIYRECEVRERGEMETEICRLPLCNMLTDSLAALVLQRPNAVVRSEGWLAMALLAKSQEGAVQIGRILSQPPVYKAMEVALGLSQEQVESQAKSEGQMTGKEQEQEPTVLATTEQQSHDKANVKLLLGTLKDQRVQISVQEEPINLDQLLSS